MTNQDTTNNLIHEDNTLTKSENLNVSDTTSIDKQIRDCFKRTLIQTEGDTELFDTDITVELLAKLISDQVAKAEKRGELRILTELPVQDLIESSRFLEAKLATLNGVKNR